MQEDSSINLLFFAGTAVLSLFSAFIILIVARQKQRHLKVKMKAEQAERKHREDLLYKVIQATEKERERIARDLHDEMGSLLSLTIMNLRSAAKTGYQPPEEVLRLLDEAQLRTRELAQQTYPTTLELFGLKHLLKIITDRLQAGGIQICYHYELGPSALHKETSLAIYRIVQELLSNTLKYAEATKINLSIREEKKLIIMEYTDDGIGTDLSVSSQGFGLNNIRSRLLFAKSIYQMQSAPGEGFILQAQFPLTSDL